MANSATAFKTITGRFFDPAAPDAADVRIDDIARALAMQPRFGGMIHFSWSVAAHSLLVAELVGPEHLKLAALMHDAAEALSGCGDVVSPVKHSEPLRGLRWVESMAEAAICFRYGISPELLHHPEVKAADRLACWAESRVLQANGYADWLPERQPPPELVEEIVRIGDRVVERHWMDVELKFLRRFREYGGPDGLNGGHER